jgi:hypothetical protein
MAAVYIERLTLFIGAVVLWFVSYPHCCIFYGLILRKLISCSGGFASVEGAMDAALGMLYKYAPFAYLYLPTAFFHVLQSSEQV